MHGVVLGYYVLQVVLGNFAPAEDLDLSLVSVPIELRVEPEGIKVRFDEKADHSDECECVLVNVQRFGMNSPPSVKEEELELRKRHGKRVNKSTPRLILEACPVESFSQQERQ